MGNEQMSRREEERDDDDGWWVDPVESEDEKRHSRSFSWFCIVMEIFFVSLLVYGLYTAYERREEMERMRRDWVIP